MSNLCSFSSVPIPSSDSLSLCRKLWISGSAVFSRAHPGTNFLSLQNMSWSALRRISGSFHGAQSCGLRLCTVVLQARVNMCCVVSSSLRYFSNSWSKAHEWGQSGIFQSPFHKCIVPRLAHLWEGSQAHCIGALLSVTHRMRKRTRMAYLVLFRTVHVAY